MISAAFWIQIINVLYIIMYRFCSRNKGYFYLCAIHAQEFFFYKYCSFSIGPFTYDFNIQPLFVFSPIKYNVQREIYYTYTIHIGLFCIHEHLVAVIGNLQLNSLSFVIYNKGFFFLNIWNSFLYIWS